MIKVGFAGFGKSFLCWNLSGLMKDTIIYADQDAPYRVWNKSEVVVEKLGQAAGHTTVLIDHPESEIAPDVVFYGVTPDLARISAFQEQTKGASCPVYAVLNGYAKAGAPWVFTSDFKPISVIPWDLRQATAPLLGIPLTKRDPSFGQYLQPMVEVISHVATL